MDMRQLRYFVQIVESGSLAKASRQLFIAQPALSQQMARLEDEVGKALFVRSSRGVSPTENGDALYHHAKFMLRQLEQAVGVARRERVAITGRVALGLAPTTVCRLGLPLVQHLREKYPGIVLNVVEALSGHLASMARADQLDLTVLFNHTGASDLTIEPLLDEELFVIVPQGSRLVAKNRTTLRLEDVAKLPLVLPSPEHGLRKRISVEFERINVQIDAVAEIDSLPLLMSCVAAGMGATIKPMAATLALGASPLRWRCLGISGTPMTRANYLYTLPPHKRSNCVEIVRNELKHVVRRLVESGEWKGVTLPVEYRSPRAVAAEASAEMDSIASDA